jgi:hypothetical protein
MARSGVDYWLDSKGFDRGGDSLANRGVERPLALCAQPDPIGSPSSA